MGVLISASRAELKSEGDGVGVANYYSRGDAFIGVEQWGSVVAVDPSSPLDGPALPGQAPGSVVYIPGQFSLRTDSNNSIRNSGDISLQWKNNDDTVSATLEHLHSDASFTYNEHVLGVQGQGFADATRFGYHIYGDATHPITYKGNFLTSGIFEPDSNQPFLASTRYDYTDSKIDDTSFELKFAPTDKLNATLRLQHIGASHVTHNYGINAEYDAVGAGVNDADAFVDLRGSTPKIEFLNDKFINPTMSDNWNGPNADFYLKSALDEEEKSNASSNAAKLDVAYELDGVWKSVKGGIYYSDKDLTIRDTQYSNWGALNEGWVLDHKNAGSYTNNTDQFERVNFGDFMRGNSLLGNTDFLFVKMANAKNFTSFVRDGCGTYNNAANGGSAPDSKSQTSSACFLASADLGNRLPNSVFAPNDVNKGSEKHFEEYVRFDFGFDDLQMPIKGNFGLRHVNYQLESEGYVTYPQPINAQYADLVQAKYPELITFANGASQLVKVKGTDYSTVLPSFNLAMSVTDKVIVRGAFSEGLYFAGLDQTVNTSVISVDATGVLQNPALPFDKSTNTYVDVVNVNISGQSKNPYLKPEEAKNYDLSAEWYFADAGSLTAGLFYKQIDHLFHQNSFRADVTNPVSNASEVVSFTGPTNAGSGSIKGIELSYSQFYDFLPGLWRGLGMQVNYTYLKQSDLNDKNPVLGGVRFDSAGNPIVDSRDSFRAFTGLPLPGYSDKNYNIIAMYELNGISARLAYNWRSDYLVTTRDSNEFAPVFNKAAGYLDGTLGYQFNDTWKINFEARNLLNTKTQTMMQIDQAGTKTNALQYVTDRTYAIGVSAKF